MARVTIAQLTTELASLREHCARREAEWEAAQQELAALRSASAPQRRSTPAPAAGQLSFKERCALARDMAMRSGRAVRVS
jgi:hypothetical protein